tara:strand:- start:1693 stop:1920 length:228 start_codon:yes stop_codon:yes gene_type:complete
MANPNTNTNEIVQEQVKRNIVSTGTIALDAQHKLYNEAIAQYDRFNDEEAKERSLALLHKMRTEIDRIEKILIQD